MKLPKLYRKIWIKWEWVSDECWDGFHHQDSGYHYYQVRRVISDSGDWDWVFIGDTPSDYSLCDRDTLHHYIVKKRDEMKFNTEYPAHLFSENRPSIKKQKEINRQVVRPKFSLFK